MEDIFTFKRNQNATRSYDVTFFEIKNLTLLQGYQITSNISSKQPITPADNNYYRNVETPPPQTKELAKPLRTNLEWNSQEAERALIEEVKAIRSKHTDRIKIAIVGQIGAGKSSFVNTILSIFRDHISTLATVRSDKTCKSTTNQYEEYEIDSAEHLVVCDTPGLFPGKSYTDTEFKYLLEGNIPNKYKFDFEAEMTNKTSGFRDSPKLSDKIHCVCIVIDIVKFDIMNQMIVQKLKGIVDLLNRKRIPVCVGLTKIDMVEPNIYEDVSRVYWSSEVVKSIGTISNRLGITRSSILPVQNYEYEIGLDTNKNILTLLAVKQMVLAAKQFIDYKAKQ